MIVSIHHTISDTAKWGEATAKILPIIQEGKLPQGIKALSYLPSVDNRRANCVWEANSVEELKRFLEPLTGAASRNEYFQVNVEQSMGLPAAEPAAVH